MRSIHVIYCVTLHEMASTGQDVSEATFKFNEEVYNYPALWDVSSVAYKDTNHKQKKIKELEGKLGFVQTFLLSFSSLLFFCFTVLRELSRPWCKSQCVVIWRTSATLVKTILAVLAIMGK